MRTWPGTIQQPPIELHAPQQLVLSRYRKLLTAVESVTKENLIIVPNIGVMVALIQVFLCHLREFGIKQHEA